MKIEAGCKAVIVDSRNGYNGVVVTVLGLAGKAGLDDCDNSNKFGDRWFVDRTFMTNWNLEVNHIGEAQMRRIDDDSRQVTSWEELADIWVPKIVETVEGRL